MEKKLENSGSPNSIVSIITTLVHGMNTCPFGNILVHTWLGLAASFKSSACSHDNKYVLVAHGLSHSIGEPVGNVHKRGVRTDAVKSKGFKSINYLCLSIHLAGSLLTLIELERCPGLHPLSMSTSRTLLMLLFEWPLFPCTEFLV